MKDDTFFKFCLGVTAIHFNGLKSRNSAMLLVGVWCLMAIVLANSYAGCLLSCHVLTVNKMGPAINSLDELAHSKDTKLIAQGGAALANQLLVDRNEI